MKNIGYIAMSIDGYIAGPEDDLTFLEGDAPKDSGKFDFSAFMPLVDKVVMGRQTYNWIKSHTTGKGLPWPYPGLKSYVLSSKEIDDNKVTLFNGTVTRLSEEISKVGSRDTWVLGGGNVFKQYIDEGIMDELWITIAPSTLGAGSRLFPKGTPDLKTWTLSEVKKAGQFVHLLYVKKYN